MELLENNIVSINGLDFKGFSFARIPYDCDFAIVQKSGEKCYRILNCKGHFSKPIKRICSDLNNPESGLILVEDFDEEKPYRFIDNVGFFSERYADVSTLETTHHTNLKNGETYCTDKSGRKLKTTELNTIGTKTRVKKTKDSGWAPLIKECFFDLRSNDDPKEPAHFYCTAEYERNFMLRALNGRYFLNKTFEQNIKKHYEKEVKALLEAREAYYYNSSQKKQKEIESSDEYYLTSDIDKVMKNIERKIDYKKTVAKKEIKNSIQKIYEKNNHELIK